ncbi:ferrochelatase [Oscillatoria amoena NRMC-F 0135]|nr:ferrochelatase [Oscillatoria amoena NRMC-F 0135]
MGLIAMNLPRKKGLLLLNLGTPDAPTPGKVRPYLREFLSDPRVIDISPLGRWLLLNLFILPFRPKQSAEAYSTIWTQRGSPLLFHTEDLCGKVAGKLPDYTVDFAMRYGNPSIESKLKAMAASGVEELTLLPLFPQYASSSTGSAVQRALEVVNSLWNTPFVRVVPHFYNDPATIAAYANCAREQIARFQPDYFVFSYHGLPERHITKSEGASGFCLKRDDSCCAAMTESNRFCYRAQCFETTRQIARTLGLRPEQYRITFQSRLGRSPWIRPYTDEVFKELGRSGKKRVLVFCPSFVADCLETLEEIAVRGKEEFTHAGGEDLQLVPSLNSNDDWVDAVVRMVRRA